MAERSRFSLLGELFQIAARDFTEISQILFKLDGKQPSTPSALLGKRKRAKNKLTNKKKHWTNKELDAVEGFLRNHLQQGGDIANIDLNILYFELGRMKDLKEIHHQVDLYKKASPFSDLRDLPFVQGKSFLDDEIEENKNIINNNNNNNQNTPLKAKSNNINNESKSAPPHKKRKTSKSPTRKPSIELAPNIDVKKVSPIKPIIKQNNNPTPVANTPQKEVVFK